MTGEMSSIDKSGKDSNGEYWPLHAAIAKSLKGELKPFDSYQGPYIAIGGDFTVGAAPYAMPVQHLGIVRLWIVPAEDDPDFCQVYREDTDKLSLPFWPYDKRTKSGMNTRKAVKLAKSLL